MFLLGMGWIVFQGHNKEKPAQEMDKALKALAGARACHADLYAVKKYTNACQHYDSAMAEWQRQNSRWIMLRNFDKVFHHASQASEIAEKAGEQALIKMSGEKEKLATRLKWLESFILDFDALYGNFPMELEDREKLAQCRLLLHEAVLALEQSKNRVCDAKLKTALEMMEGLDHRYAQILHEYFEKFPQWKENVKNTVEDSKKNRRPCLIVDKFSRECHLYKNGKPQASYQIELGLNWIGDKNQQGDKATPEGEYKIVRKLQKGATRYYKAFLLNYPNEEDKKRFSMNKKNGEIHPQAKIGGLIEIHGHGGKGTDWTEGCIALNNDHMDQLYNICQIGTPVTIVGSLKPLEEIISERNEQTTF
jgi:hypothetical protein